MEEDAKIQFVFKNIHHKSRKTDIATLKAAITTSKANTVSYTTVANHLSKAVSQLPEYVAKNRNIIWLSKQDNGIYRTDGSVIEDQYIPN